MKIDNKEWNDMKTFPQENQKCQVIIIKDVYFLGRTKNGTSEWKDVPNGTHRFFAWRPLEGEKNE